ncbi:MAG: manganese efflux pump MntP family protein [candidate division FCPU426 bacterium]
MSWIALLLVAVGLGMDAFAVAVATGVKLCRVNWRQAGRMSLAFGFFQFAMTAAGWLGGRTLSGFLHAVDHWVAFTLLAVVGGRMVWGGWHPEQAGWRAEDPTRGWLLLTLALATSVDALAVGFGFSLLQIPIWGAAGLIGVVALLMTLVGLHIGCRVGLTFGQRMEILGGLLLIGIGIKILVDHLT